LLTIGSLKSSPQPGRHTDAGRIRIGIFGHLAGSKALIVVGIALVFAAGLLAPQY